MGVEMTTISCPRCLRQYDAKVSMTGKLGKCGVCKAHFSIAVTELAASSNEAIVFDEPLMVRNSLIIEGCTMMAWNIRCLLNLADEAVTPEAVADIANTIPRCVEDLNSDWWKAKRCNQTLQRAHDRTFGTARAALWEMIFDYFVVHIPSRHFDVIEMLSGAFVGVLGDMEFDTPEDVATTDGGLVPSENGRWLAKVWRVLRR